MAAPIMTPINREDFAPDFSAALNNIELEWKEHNWMGRIIYWIRTSDSKGLFQRTFVHTVALIAALVLMVSVIGVPLLIYATKELVRQQERSNFVRKFNYCKGVASDNARMRFLLGRRGLFEGIEIKLQPSTRNKIIQDLIHLGITDEKSAVPLTTMRDGDLLRMILNNDHNSFANYGLKVTG